MITQLALERTRDGISVYFYVTMIILTVPLNTRCLLFITSWASLGSNSAFFIAPTTSSSTTSIFLWVLSYCSIGSCFNSSYFFYMNIELSLSLLPSSRFCSFFYPFTLLSIEWEVGRDLNISPRSILLLLSLSSFGWARTLPAADFTSFYFIFNLLPKTSSICFSLRSSNLLKSQSRENLLVTLSLLTLIPILACEGDTMITSSNFLEYIYLLVSNYLSRVVLPEPGFPTRSMRKWGSKYSFSSPLNFTPSTCPCSSD